MNYPTQDTPCIFILTEEDVDRLEDLYYELLQDLHNIIWSRFYPLPGQDNAEESGNLESLEESDFFSPE